MKTAVHQWKPKPAFWDFRNLTLLSCALGALTQGCSTVPEIPKGTPCQVSYRDYRSGLRIGLINEALLAGNSESRPPLGTKVVSDGVMELLIEDLGGAGFFTDARPTRLPQEAPGDVFQGIEIRLGDRVHSLILNGNPADPRDDEFSSYVQIFRTVFDGTFQAISIRKDGKSYFEAKRRELERQQKERGDNP